MSDELLHCSFSSKTAIEVKKLIAGTDVFICDECVDLCHNILHTEGETQDETETATEEVASIPSPREIKAFLDEYVIGQGHAKEVLAVAVFNHYKRLANPVIDGTEIEKSNILMLGPTGSGKTLLAQTIARQLQVPFAIADATSLTEAGYVGDDVESIITRLLQAAAYDVRQAERGIIFIDEIDKKRAAGRDGGVTRDVSGEGVQQALLKLLEGSEVLVPAQGGRKNPNAEMIRVNTRNILFVVGGAFVGLEKIIERTASKDQAGIGFSATVQSKQKKSLADMIDQMEPEHLVAFGMIPELIGRLPVWTVLSELSEMELVAVLTQPRNALTRQYKGLFKMNGVALEFDSEALLGVAQIARKRKVGGRALRNILERVLLKTQFVLPDLKRDGVERVTVTRASIEQGAMPVLHYSDTAKAV